MIATHDPTNANAVAGPSRLPAQPPPSAAPSSQPGGAAAATTSGGPSGAPSSAAPPAKKDPVRRADGPVIMPTRIGADGVREVPAAFEHCEVEDLITLIASMLDRLIEHNDRIPLTSNSLTRFHSRAPPNISVKDYLVRIARYTNVEPCCLLILLPYVDKVCARMSSFTISSLTVHRFIIAAISVGSKALSDAFCTNGRYSRVGGVSIVEMNLLEKEFCEALDWRLTTSGPVLAHYYSSLVRSHPSYRLSDAPAPIPPTPPPIDIPAPFSPSPTDARLQPFSPAAAFFGAGAGARGAAEMEVDGAADGVVGAAGGGQSGDTAMSTDPSSTSTAASARRRSPSPSAPPSPAARPSSTHSSSSLSASSTSASLSRSESSSPSLSHPSPSRGRPPARTGITAEFAAAVAAHPAGPPLVPPNLRRLSSSASNLPSPARGVFPPSSSASAAGGGGSALAMSPPGVGRAGSRPSARAVSPAPAASPAKRGRVVSGAGMTGEESLARRVSSEATAAGGGAGGGAGGAGVGDADRRFQPSPRLDGGARTAAESALGLGAG